MFTGGGWGSIGNGGGLYLTPLTTQNIKKAKALIQYMLAQMAVGNKIYPNVWIFYGKNWFGMKDQQDITITPNNQLQPNMTREQIIEKVKADVVIDADDD